MTNICAVSSAPTWDRRLLPRHLSATQVEARHRLPKQRCRRHRYVCGDPKLRHDYLFSRCSFWATTILVAPNDLNNGRELTRAYNKKQHGPETYAAVELTTDRGTATVPVARLAPPS
jgi:hypothetical protein